MHRFSFLAASGLSFLLSATGVAAFELDHSAGTLKLDTPPARIVTYDLGVLDSLQALEAGEVVGVPKSVYRGSLKPYQDTPVVGTLFEPDYPALEGLKPDLIFAGGRARAQIPNLQKVAPTIEHVTDPGTFLDDFYKNSQSLAKAFDKEENARVLMDSIASNVDALEQVNKGKTAAFLFVIRDNVIAHAPGDRFGYAYELAGLESVLPPSEAGSQPAAPRPEPGSDAAKAAQAERAKVIRQVAKAEPDWLIVLDRGAINDGEKTAAATLSTHADISQTRAFRQGKVYYADPNAWYIVTTGLNNLNQITADLLDVMQD